MSQRIDRIGKFEIIESLGEGSLGEVFLARDTIIGREVVVRIVRRASLVPPDPLGSRPPQPRECGDHP
jgi:serine/threonine protein kinase